jgi:hypothetical protein
MCSLKVGDQPKIPEQSLGSSGAASKSTGKGNGIFGGVNRALSQVLSTVKGVINDSKLSSLLSNAKTTDNIKDKINNNLNELKDLKGKSCIEINSLVKNTNKLIKDSKRLGIEEQNEDQKEIQTQILKNAANVSNLIKDEEQKKDQQNLKNTFNNLGF